MGLDFDGRPCFLVCLTADNPLTVPILHLNKEQLNNYTTKQVGKIFADLLGCEEKCELVSICGNHTCERI